jgi:hypothetical protein
MPSTASSVASLALTGARPTNVVTGLHGLDEAKLLMRSVDGHARQFQRGVLTGPRTHTPCQFGHATLAPSSNFHSHREDEDVAAHANVPSADIGAAMANSV